jgi:hypothetical protein
MEYSTSKTVSLMYKTDLRRRSPYKLIKFDAFDDENILFHLSLEIFLTLSLDSDPESDPDHHSTQKTRSESAYNECGSETLAYSIGIEQKFLSQEL